MLILVGFGGGHGRAALYPNVLFFSRVALSSSTMPARRNPILQGTTPLNSSKEAGSEDSEYRRSLSSAKRSKQPTGQVTAEKQL